MSAKDRARRRRGGGGQGEGGAPSSRFDPGRLPPDSGPVVDSDDLQTAYAPSFGDFDTTGDVASRFDDALSTLARDGSSGVADAGDLVLGRVVRLDRGYPLVLTADGLFRSEHAIALVKGADVRCAVGDWVVVSLPAGHDKTQVLAILERKGVLSRWDGDSRGGRQVLAANIDVLAVVQPLSKREVPTERIVRSLVLAGQGGMEAAVVLTKCDRSPDASSVARDVARVRSVIGDEVPIIAASSATGEGVDAVRDLVPPGSCTLLLGESGAGKSTLINALIGRDVLASGAVRDKDDRGRHTTVARRMLKIPGAGVLIDAPGLRSIYLLDEELGLARAFSEIDGLVGGCRFRDCSHGSEPGCAVREAVDDGRIDSVRLDAYRRLAAEMDENRRRLDLSAPSSITR